MVHRPQISQNHCSSPLETAECPPPPVLDSGFPPDARSKNLPIPVKVPDSIDEIGQTNISFSNAPLPPLLTYDGGTDSILMHSLAIADDTINLDFIRWGPGIHLTQFQAMENLFSFGPPKNVSGNQSAVAAAIRSDLGHDRSDYDSTSAFLTAVAMDNVDGTLTIKYRANRFGRHSAPPLSIKEAYANREQTLRAIIKKTSTEPHPISILATHLCLIGRRMPYLVLTTLAQAAETGKKVLSLYKIPERLLFSEVCNMSEHDADQGLRWQVQTFELPLEATSIAPIVLDLDGTSFLVIFYFYRHMLHYAALRYAGSGSFVDFVPKSQCLPTASEGPSSQAQGPESSSRSRFSISTRLSVFSQGLDAGPRAEDSGKEQELSLPRSQEGCRPYALIENGWVWVFYEGAAMDGIYVRRRLTGDITDFDKGWESVSWPTGAPKESVWEGVAGTSGHMIPIVVPGNFIAMY